MPCFLRSYDGSEHLLNAILAMSLPFFCFVSATFLELRGDNNSLRSLARALPLAVAGAASALLLIPLPVYWSINVSSDPLSRPLSVVALLVAPSGFVCRYKSHFAATLIVFGGAVLAFFWYLNRVIE
jgi:hypothetical protein